MSAYGPPQTELPDDLKYGSNRRYDPAEARRRVESMRADLFAAGRPPSYAKLMYDLSDVELLLTNPPSPRQPVVPAVRRSRAERDAELELLSPTPRIVEPDES